MREGERQVSPNLEGIRRDHVARYEWAAKHVQGRVLDAACGIGYGSKLLADSGFLVRAVDIDAEAIDYATRHYYHPNVWYVRSDVNQAGPFLNDTTIAFEMIEHVGDPLPFLQRLSGRLLASVPNEDVFPYRNYKYHFRHYTKGEFEDLLTRAGFTVTSWWGQEGPESEVEPDVNGRTLIAIGEK